MSTCLPTDAPDQHQGIVGAFSIYCEGTHWALMVADILPATGSPVAVMGSNSERKLALNSLDWPSQNETLGRVLNHEQFCSKKSLLMAGSLTQIDINSKVQAIRSPLVSPSQSVHLWPSIIVGLLFFSCLDH